MQFQVTIYKVLHFDCILFFCELVDAAIISQIMARVEAPYQWFSLSHHAQREERVACLKFVITYGLMDV